MTIGLNVFRGMGGPPCKKHGGICRTFRGFKRWFWYLSVRVLSFKRSTAEFLRYLVGYWAEKPDLPLKSEKRNSNQAHKTGSWYPLGFLAKFPTSTPALLIWAPCQMGISFVLKCWSSHLKWKGEILLLPLHFPSPTAKKIETGKQLITINKKGFVASQADPFSSTPPQRTLVHALVFSLVVCTWRRSLCTVVMWRWLFTVKFHRGGSADRHNCGASWSRSSHESLKGEKGNNGRYVLVFVHAPTRW